MKRLFLAVCTVAVLASCSKDEVVSYNKSSVINFGNAFVDKSTRTAIDPSYSNDNLFSEFAVYGAVETTVSDTFVNIFDGVTVTSTAPNDASNWVGTGWYYPIANLQYWIDGRDYKFAAVVGAAVHKTDDDETNDVDANGMPTRLCVNAGDDALYAATSFTYDASSPTPTPTTVNFTFSHLMSKVKFIAKTTALASSYSYKVTNITIKDAADGGVYTINGGRWAPNQSTYDVLFGNIAATPDDAGAGADATPLQGTSETESNWERLLIPQQIDNVTFTVTLYKGETVISTEEKTIDLSPTTDPATPALVLEAGHAYNFIINLPAPGYPITFGVQEITGWDDNLGAGNNVTVQ